MLFVTLPEWRLFMSYIAKPLEQLDLLDDFLINAVASDEHVGTQCCRKILSILLQKQIGKMVRSKDRNIVRR